MMPLRLILASASPRRQCQLREAGYAFVVFPADIDEDAIGAGLLPARAAELLAKLKAQRVAAQYHHDVTLAADTVVALGDSQLNKPRDAAHARQMLLSLSGTTHQAITAVTLLRPSHHLEKSALVTSTVQMRQLGDAEIDHYVAGGLWQGKAGGYGIQDDDPFVTRITGSLSNIVGLPMEITTQLLGEAGVYPIA